MHSCLSLYIFALSFLSSTYGAFRVKRDGKLSTRWITRRGGIDIPYSLEAVITCLIPGLNEYFCFGPRTNVFEPRELLLTDRKGQSFGTNNGVDVRLLNLFNIPNIEGQTNIGEKIGAIWTHDGVEFGRRLEAFKGFRQNVQVVPGGTVEYGKGAEVDIGARIDAADGAVRLQISPVGVNVGRLGKGIANPLGYPWARALTTKRGSRWYKDQFYNQGDEFKTPAERACPWCLFGT